MLFLIFGEDQDVIKVNRHLPFRDQVMENVIHLYWKVAGKLVSLKNITVGS